MAGDADLDIYAVFQNGTNIFILKEAPYCLT